MEKIVSLFQNQQKLFDIKFEENISFAQKQLIH